MVETHKKKHHSKMNGAFGLTVLLLRLRLK